MKLKVFVQQNVYVMFSKHCNDNVKTNSSSILPFPYTAPKKLYQEWVCFPRSVLRRSSLVALSSSASKVGRDD